MFIEEAAGISKYKERRRETENRIRHTQDNLERLEDVRGELGRQLEKLQRQAAAAKRYTTLKAQERTLKSELAAIRWLKHDDHLQKLQQTQQQLDTDIEALRARQRGDEAGIEKYRDTQQNCKQKLDYLQQNLFTVSATISRLEQSALHNQQRLKQIDSELSDIQTQQEALNEEQELLTVQAEEHAELVVELEPAYEIQQAACEQLEVTRDQAEAALHQHQRDFQQTDQQYHQLKQQVHSHHSKVQSLLQMQMRTQQRIGELEREIQEFSQADHQQAIDDLQLELEMLAEQILEQQDKVQSARQALEQSQRQYEQARQQTQSMRAELQQNQSRRVALETLQQAASPTGPQPEGVVPLWQQLTPKPGAAAIIEHVLSELGDAQLASGESLATLTENQESLSAGVKYFSQAALTRDKQSGSVAALLEDEWVPHQFNQILVAEDVENALAMRQQAGENQLIVTHDGQWFGPDWFRYGEQDTEQGVLQRAEQIEELNDTIAAQEAKLATLEEQESEAQNNIEQAREQVSASEGGLNERNNQRQQLTQRLSWLSEQQRQEAQKRERLDDELNRQQEQLEEEATELAMLNEGLENYEMELAEQAERQARLQDQQQSLQQQLSSQRSQYEQNTRELHQMALKLQESRNKQQSLNSQQQRISQQLTSLGQRAAQLEQEQQSLNQPQTEQAAQLQDLLAEKAALEEQRYSLQQDLEHAQELLNQAMQGQQAIVGDIAKRQEQLDSLKIEAEGYRVRGTAILEQLSEIGVTLKAVLETLPAETSETNWQRELEQTTAAISRLGAVNLAAVEEYDVQAERKAHLDTQFDDLNDALETLQNAIRKIDRETRSRFSQTFEQVNEDLKMLFPKVFGGGSAYLALTDDDLLETGVTIMARPPGKKNSTIHLLSGGEKALTALSLVFAIFRLNPAPFCLLDEVDAPLDDANVGRFCNLVSEMSKSVQFIYISHNKIAMEMASHLTGVTMAEPGVSRMVAVDVDEAVSMVDA